MEILPTLLGALERPEPYQPASNLWTHPHIAGEMLKAHLSPDTDAASYRPATIAAICEFLPQAMALRDGATVVDLGCGPGLYCQRLALKGYKLTGIDLSESSLAYARSLCHGLSADFRLGSYLSPFGYDAFDAALMVSQDYGVLSPAGRRTLLGNLHHALRPGGRFALDVPTVARFTELRGSSTPTWEAAESGFWRPHPYLTLKEEHFYPEEHALCQRYLLWDGEWTVYQVWQTFFTPDSLSRELANGGFEVESVWASLLGDTLTDASPVMGVLCRKVP